MTHDDKTITFEQLVQFVSGELTGDDRLAFERRLANADSTWTRTQDRLELVMQTMRQDESEPATSAAIRRALTVFSNATKVGMSLADRLERLGAIVAELVFDSRAQPVLAGFRSESDDDHQLAYESDLGKVGLTITEPDEHDTDTWRIRGQVFPATNSAPTRVTLARDCEERESAALDGSGHFDLRAGTGSYELVFEFDTAGPAMVLPGVDLL